MMKRKRAVHQGPGSVPPRAPQPNSNLRPQAPSQSSSSYGNQLPGKSLQPTLRKKATSGHSPSSLFVQPSTHSKPWALGQGHRAFASKQGGVSFANDADDQYNQEEDDDSFDEQKQQAQFRQKMQKKHGTDIFQQALATGHTLYDTSKNISRQVIMEEETQRNISQNISNSMNRTNKTLGTQRSGNTQKQPFGQLRKRSFKASNSPNVEEHYFANPELTTNKDTTLLPQEANAFNKKEVIQKHLQELNDRYEWHDQVQAGESIFGLVKKKSQLLFDFVKQRTASSGQESKPKDKSADTPRGQLSSLRERREKKQREQFPNKHMYGPGDLSIKQRSAAQLLVADDHEPSKFESNRRLTEMRKHEQILDLESSMVPSHKIWQEERHSNVVQMLQQTQKTHVNNRAYSGFTVQWPQKEQSESSDSLQYDKQKKDRQSYYDEGKQDNTQKMGSINDSRIQGDDSILDDEGPPRNAVERQRGSRKAAATFGKYNERLLDQSEAQKIDEQSLLDMSFNKQLLINSAIIFLILLLSSSDFRFENEMQKQRLEALRQERSFTQFQIYNMDDQRHPNSSTYNSTTNKNPINNYQDSTINIYETLNERTLDAEFIEEVAQVVHLTTAIFLILLGAHLEYIKSGDFYVFLFLFIVSSVKMVTGAVIVTQSERLSRYHERQQSINIYIWFWLREYTPAPLEIFFAISDSIKYIQFVYLAKWIERKHLITVIGFWYLLYGIVSAINNTVLTKGQKSQFLLRDIFFSEKESIDMQSHPSKKNQMEFESKGLTQILSGSLLLFVSFLQYKLSTLDPMDSDLIVNEQCLYLSSQHDLPHVTKVMRRSNFENTIRQKLWQRHNKSEPRQVPARVKPQSAAAKLQSKLSRQQQKNIESQINETIDEILGKNKSISFYELLQIPAIQNVIFASMCMTVNYLISKGMSAKIAFDACDYEPLACEKSGSCKKMQSCSKRAHEQDDIYSSVLVYILNVDLLGGILLLIMGFLSSNSLFQGRRTPLIFSSILVTIIWNIVWVCTSSIQELEQRSQQNGGEGNFTEHDLSLFDRIMYRGDCAWTFLVYQMMIIAIPIDLCKTQMMKANVRIYAILFSLMVAIKLTIQGLVFDNYLNKIIISDFIYLRFFVIIISILALCAMVPLFVDETREILSNIRNRRQIKGQIDAVKEKMMQSKEKKKKAKDRERLHGKHKAAQVERIHRYRVYSDGSSNVMKQYRTPSSQGPPPQVQYDFPLERRESFDSYQNLMSDEEPVRARECRQPPQSRDTRDAAYLINGQRSPQRHSSPSDEAISSRTFSDNEEEALARRVSKHSRQRKKSKKSLNTAKH